MKCVKNRITCVIALGAAMLFSGQVQGQLLNRIKHEVKSHVENKVVKEAGDATEKTMEAAKDKATGALQGNEEGNTSTADGGDDKTPAKGRTNKADYKSYDFVPGDKIIFEPDLSSEPDAELPARFSIQKGNAEIQSYDGEKILHLDAGGYVTLTPLMTTENYLPEQFTVEFDMMWENDQDYFAYVNDFWLQFYKEDDGNYEGYGLYEFTIHSNSDIYLGKHGSNRTVVKEALKNALNTNNVWHHIAFYVRNNIAKAYINEYRVAASNNMPTGATKLAIRSNGNYGFKIKNFRLAAGGADKYNKIVTDGKFITHGILFDVNKSTIKPESMGALNEIARLMKNHADLKFEVQGHTDSDGTDDANMRLSQDRADAVKEKLESMGVEKGRLTSKGFGETEPLDKNDTAEGKANNRRVEFIKK